MVRFILLVNFILLYGLETQAQIIKTSLQIIVRNELGNTESDVNVRLFKSKEDYDKLEHAATPVLKTDKNGKVTFKELEPIVYFINAEKGDHNNFGAGEQTAPLEANRINKITVVISE
jgi:hypothetical protein